MYQRKFICTALILIGAAIPRTSFAQGDVIYAVPAEAAPADVAKQADDAKNKEAPPAADAAAKPAAGAAGNDAKAKAKPRRARQATADEVLAVAAELAVNPANQNPIQQQIRAHLEPMLKVELSFVNRAAALNDDERRALTAASVKWLDEFVVDFAKHQDRNQQQMWLQGMQGLVIVGNHAEEDPRESMQRGVSEAAAATLPKEKVAAYEKQCAVRDEFDRDVSIAKLVQQIDDKVILSREQRAKLAESLTKHWDKSWAPQLEAFLVGNNMWISFPDQWVLPELTDSQRAVIRQLNRNRGQMFRGMWPGMEGGVIDDIDLDDVPRTAENEQHD